MMQWLPWGAAKWIHEISHYLEYLDDTTELNFQYHYHPVKRWWLLRKVCGRSCIDRGVFLDSHENLGRRWGLRLNFKICKCWEALRGILSFLQWVIRGIVMGLCINDLRFLWLSSSSFIRLFYYRRCVSKSSFNINVMHSLHALKHRFIVVRSI